MPPEFAKRLTAALVSAAMVPMTLGTGRALAADMPEDLFELAVKNDPIYNAQRAETEAGLEAYRIRRGGVLPQITGTASVTRIDSDIEFSGFDPSAASGGAGGQGSGGGSFAEEYDSIAYGVNLRQPVFRWDLFSRLERGRIEVLAATVALRRARQELVGRITTAYFNVLAARDALDTVRSEAVAVERNLTQVRDLFEVGQIAVTGLREAQARQDITRAAVIEAELAVASARDALSEIVGTEDFTLTPLRGQHSDVALKYPNLPQWVEQAMTRNSAVVAATIRYRLAEQDIRQADSRRLPELDLTAGYNVSDSSDSTIGQRGEQATIGLELTVPIFAGGARRAEARAARASYLQRAEELRTAQVQAKSEVRRAYRSVRTADRRVSALEAAARSTQAALEAVRDGYEVGNRTIVDVLDAEQAALRAQRDLNAARYNYLTAMIDLELAAGTTTDADWQRLEAAILGRAAVGEGAPAASGTSATQPVASR